MINRVAIVVLLLLTGIAIGGVAAAFISAAWIGAAIGGIIGLGLGLQHAEKNVRRRAASKVLALIKDPHLLARIHHIEKAVGKGIFSRPSDYYLLHEQIGETTEAIKNGDDQIREAWSGYLQVLQGLTIFYSRLVGVSIDCVEHIKRLEKRLTTLTCSPLSLGAPSYSKDVKEIADLHIECFGSEISTSQIKKSGGFIVRDSSEAILGFLLFAKEGENGLHITHMGRKSGSPKRGIGELLFRKFLEQDLSCYANVSLHVRESNTAAHALYKKFGFQIVKTVERYFSCPSENAVVMSLKLLEIQSA